MADIIDHANDQAQWLLDAALAVASEQSSALPASSLADCIGCDEPIPEARRTATKGCIRCIDCQQAHEDRRARHAR
nr:TraR/DksA C4-type zinc finger protein [uncultured Pseudomonas sp.]